jgi:hypothetical protein
MKTCLIYGHNGLDLDVTFNLVSFYKKIGFKTVFSENLVDADLLVVIRAVDKPIDLSNFQFSLIHVFDYGGWGYDKFVTSINPVISYIFTTSETTREHLINDFNFPEEHLFVALPPVETSLWLAKERKVKFDFVHVGNFKKIEDGDLIRPQFIAAIQKFKANVWGLGWNLDNKDKYHGKSGLFEVSDIYAQAKFALGLMYPFQRNVTFSGRFWHAPLNGCYLISEAGLYSQKVPGIIETNYTIDDIKAKIQFTQSKTELQSLAIRFWDERYLDVKLIVLETIKTNVFVKRSPTLKGLIIFYKLKGNNYLRFLYQKFKLYKIL